MKNQTLAFAEVDGPKHGVQPDTRSAGKTEGEHFGGVGADAALGCQTESVAVTATHEVEQGLAHRTEPRRLGGNGRYPERSVRDEV